MEKDLHERFQHMRVSAYDSYRDTEWFYVVGSLGEWMNRMKNAYPVPDAA